MDLPTRRMAIFRRLPPLWATMPVARAFFVPGGGVPRDLAPRGVQVVQPDHAGDVGRRRGRQLGALMLAKAPRPSAVRTRSRLVPRAASASAAVASTWSERLLADAPSTVSPGARSAPRTVATSAGAAPAGSVGASPIGTVSAAATAGTSAQPQTSRVDRTVRNRRVEIASR
jgi:hypothetical protein